VKCNLSTSRITTTKKMWSKLARDSLICILHFATLKELTQVHAHVNKSWNSATKVRHAWRYVTVPLNSRPPEVYGRSIQNVAFKESWIYSDVFKYHHHIVRYSHYSCNVTAVPAHVYQFLEELTIDMSGRYTFVQWHDLCKFLPSTLKQITLKKQFDLPVEIGLAKFSESLERLKLVGFTCVSSSTYPKLTHLTLAQTSLSSIKFIAPNLTSLTLKRVVTQTYTFVMAEFLPASSNLKYFSYGHERERQTQYNTILAARAIMPSIARSIVSLEFIGALKSVEMFPYLEVAGIHVNKRPWNNRMSTPRLTHLKLVAGVADFAFVEYYKSIVQQIGVLTILIELNEFVGMFVRKCCNLKMIRTNAKCLFEICNWIDPHVRIIQENL